MQSVLSVRRLLRHALGVASAWACVAFGALALLLLVDSGELTPA